MNIYEFQNIIKDQQEQIEVMKDALQKYKELFKQKQGISLENQNLIHQNKLLQSELSSYKQYKQVSETLSTQLQSIDFKFTQLIQENQKLKKQNTQNIQLVTTSDQTIDRLQSQIQLLQQQLYQYQNNQNNQNFALTSPKVDILGTLDNFLQKESIFAPQQAQFVLSNQNEQLTSNQNVQYKNLPQNPIDMNTQLFTNQQQQFQQIQQVQQIQQIQPQQPQNPAEVTQQSFTFTESSIKIPEQPKLKVPQTQKSKASISSSKNSSMTSQISSQSSQQKLQFKCEKSTEHIPKEPLQQLTPVSQQLKSQDIALSHKAITELDQSYNAPQEMVQSVDASMQKNSGSQIKLYESRGESNTKSVFENSIDNELIECEDEQIINENQYLKEELYYANTIINKLTCEDHGDIIFAPLPE